MTQFSFWANFPFIFAHSIGSFEDKIAIVLNIENQANWKDMIL